MLLTTESGLVLTTESGELIAADGPSGANPKYPTVPKAPGVPPVLRQPGSIPATVAFVTSDVSAVLALFSPPKWGIVDSTSGAFIFEPDTYLGVDFREEWRVPTYPIENGGFSAYNKVLEPYDVRVTFAIGSPQNPFASIVGGLTGTSGSARSALLAQLNAAAGSLNLYTVLTPDQSYTNVNIIHVSYDRRAAEGGASMLVIEVWLKYINLTVTSSYSTSQTPTPDTSNAQNPAAQPEQNQGSVQPYVPSNTSPFGSAH